MFFRCWMDSTEMTLGLIWASCKRANYCPCREPTFGRPAHIWKIPARDIMTPQWGDRGRYCDGECSRSSFRHMNGMDLRCQPCTSTGKRYGITPVQAMKAYKERRYSFTPAQPRHYISGSSLRHAPAVLAPRNNRITHWIRSWVNPKASLSVVEKMNSYFNRWHPAVFEY